MVIDDVAKSFPLRRTLGEIARRSPAPRVVAVDGVSMALGARRTLGIVGESGSGKSTLAKCIVRLIDPDRGTIRFRGSDLAQASKQELREARRRIQMIYQDPYSSLNPRLKVGDAILEPAIVHGLIRRRDASSRLDHLLSQVGLAAELGERRPRALSGGQRQRVAIARALAVQPEILIADEAVSALDVSVQAQILNLLSELQHTLDLSMIFISHQLSIVAHISDYIAVMYLGRVVEYGPTAEVFARPRHPYTVGLFAAQPGHRPRKRHDVAVRGELPSPLNIPTGCRFRTRCPLAAPICAEVDPDGVAISPDHTAWCHVLPKRQDGTTIGGLHIRREDVATP